MIDDVAIYNRALSEDEILEVMEKGHQIIAVQPLSKLTKCWGEIKISHSR
jgi:hypothetical protein